MGYCLRYQGRDFKLVGPMTVGRGVSCTIPIDDPLVSRTHATIFLEGEKVVVDDMRSRNGVFVNGQLIQGKAEVKPGDTITIGSQQLLLVLGDAGADFLDGHTMQTSRTATVEDTPLSRGTIVEFITLGGKEYAVVPKQEWLRIMKAGRQTLEGGGDGMVHSARGKKPSRRR